MIVSAEYAILEQPDTHIQLLRDGRLVLRTMSQDLRIRENAAPELFHVDLKKRNIFVDEDDPATPTCFIDWQSTSISLAFWAADIRSKFVAIAERLGDLTDNDMTPLPDIEGCCQSFNIYMDLHFLTFAAARSLDIRLRPPFKYGHRTWNNGPVAFRHNLTTTSKEWEYSGFESLVPFRYRA
jgi:hypothetical protein